MGTTSRPRQADSASLLSAAPLSCTSIEREPNAVSIRRIDTPYRYVQFVRRRTYVRYVRSRTYDRYVRSNANADTYGAYGDVRTHLYRSIRTRRTSVVQFEISSKIFFLLSKQRGVLTLCPRPVTICSRVKNYELANLQDSKL